jgi:hypothetical protein
MHVRLRSLVNATNHPCAYLHHPFRPLLLLPVSHDHITAERVASFTAQWVKWQCVHFGLQQQAWLLQVCMVYIAVAGRCTPCFALALRCMNPMRWMAGPDVPQPFFCGKKRKRGQGKSLLDRFKGAPRQTGSISFSSTGSLLLRCSSVHMIQSLLALWHALVPLSNNREFLATNAKMYHVWETNFQLKRCSEGKLEYHVSVVFFSEDGSFFIWLIENSSEA